MEKAAFQHRCGLMWSTAGFNRRLVVAEHKKGPSIKNQSNPFCYLSPLSHCICDCNGHSTIYKDDINSQKNTEVFTLLNYFIILCYYI